MKEFREWLDVVAKVLLAFMAAVVGYYFSYQRQQNEDIRLIVDMSTSPEASRRLMGASLAQSYAADRRIPQDLYLAVFNYANQQDDQKMQVAVNSGAAQLSRGSTQIKRAIDNASAALPVRVYFHIRDEADREAARQISKLVETSAPPDGQNIIVPGVQLISGTQSKSILKCFTAVDCSTLAPVVARLFVDNGIDIQLSDQSKRYEDSSTIRPKHFEAWFAPGIPKVLSR